MWYLFIGVCRRSSPMRPTVREPRVLQRLRTCQPIQGISAHQLPDEIFGFRTDVLPGVRMELELPGHDQLEQMLLVLVLGVVAVVVVVPSRRRVTDALVGTEWRIS